MTTAQRKRKPRPTKTERLQAAWDTHAHLMEAEIVFRPFRGWYAEPMEIRHPGDDGDFLGGNYDEALAGIAWLAG